MSFYQLGAIKAEKDIENHEQSPVSTSVKPFSFKMPIHIVEAMEQILLTRPKERGMEYHFKSDIDTDIFEPNDPSTHTLLAYQVEEALKELEDRIKVNSVEIESEDSVIYAIIHYTVLMYDTSYTSKVKVGDINVQNSNAGDRLY